MRWQEPATGRQDLVPRLLLLRDVAESLSLSFCGCKMGMAHMLQVCGKDQKGSFTK